MGMSCMALISPRSGIIISPRPETGQHTRVCCLIAALPVLTHQKERERQKLKRIFLFAVDGCGRTWDCLYRCLPVPPPPSYSKPQFIFLLHDQALESIVTRPSSLTRSTGDWGTAGPVFETLQNFLSHVINFSERIFDHLLNGRSKKDS